MATNLRAKATHIPFSQASEAPKIFHLCKGHINDRLNIQKYSLKESPFFGIDIKFYKRYLLGHTFQRVLSEIYRRFY